MEEKMNLKEAALHCKTARSNYAKKSIERDDVFYLFKMQEELGELTRSFLELERRGVELKSTDPEVKRKFEGDIASVVGNALILANYYNVDIEKAILAKFPAQNK